MGHEGPGHWGLGGARGQEGSRAGSGARGWRGCRRSSRAPVSAFVATRSGRRPSALCLPCGVSGRRCLLILRPSTPFTRPPPHFKVCAAGRLRRGPGWDPSLPHRSRHRGAAVDRAVGGGRWGDTFPRMASTETPHAHFRQAGSGIIFHLLFSEIEKSPPTPTPPAALANLRPEQS